LSENRKNRCSKSDDSGHETLAFSEKDRRRAFACRVQREHREKKITGHVGLEQSITMIADVLAWKLDMTIVEPVEPVIAKKQVQSKTSKSKLEW